MQLRLVCSGTSLYRARNIVWFLSETQELTCSGKNTGGSSEDEFSCKMHSHIFSGKKLSVGFKYAGVQVKIFYLIDFLLQGVVPKKN